MKSIYARFPVGTYLKNQKTYSTFNKFSKLELILKFDSLRQLFICYFHVLCGVNIDAGVFQDLKLLSCLRHDHAL